MLCLQSKRMRSCACAGLAFCFRELRIPNKKPSMSCYWPALQAPPGQHPMHFVMLYAPPATFHHPFMLPPKLVPIFMTFACSDSHLSDALYSFQAAMTMRAALNHREQAAGYCTNGAPQSTQELLAAETAAAESASLVSEQDEDSMVRREMIDHLSHHPSGSKLTTSLLLFDHIQQTHIRYLVEACSAANCYPNPGKETDKFRKCLS